MRQIFLAMLVITFLLNVFFPWLVYKAFGFFYVYYPVSELYADYAALILSASLLITAFIILISKNGKLPAKYLNENACSSFIQRSVDPVFYFSILINIINAISIGGFKAIISGAANSTLIAYLQFFFDIRILFFLSLYKSFESESFKTIIFNSFLYLLVSVLYASRSGLFWMVLFYIILIKIFHLTKNIKRKINIVLVIAILCAPLIFTMATNKRDSAINAFGYIAKVIVARLSYVEVGAIELEQYYNETYVSEVFQKKYGLINQAKMIINQFMPVDPFDFDVHPNQYWRTIFADYPYENSRRNYQSMYMILPFYLLLKYGPFIGFLLFILVIYFLVLVISKIRNVGLASFFACYVFYTIFQYFDWVYHFADLMCFVLTILTLKIYSISFTTKKLRGV